MRKHIFLNLDAVIPALVICCLPLLGGWQKIELKGFLEGKSKAREASQAAANLTKPKAELSAFEILQKVEASLFSLKTVEVNTELWLEHDLFHIKTDFKQSIEDVDNSQTNGRQSLSLIIPDGASTSEWAQTYDISGIPFTWDSQQREWKKKELVITGKDSKAVLAYGFLQTLFQVNQDEIDPDSIAFKGIEKRNGKDCFVLEYALTQEKLKRWDVSGSLKNKIWVDKEVFYPYTIRSEGMVSGMYFLQIVNFSRFNAATALQAPPVVATQIKEEKEKLKVKIDSLVQEVAQIRGWEPIKNIDVEFVKRPLVRRHFEEDFDRQYNKAELAGQERIFKWLGLIPENIDLRDALINSEVSTVAGFYDPKQQKIFIGNWIHPAIADPVLVHEITHAYQDKMVAMAEFLERPEVKNSLDATIARHALLEGEAEAVMLEYLLKKDGASFKDLGDIFSFIEEKILKGSQYSRDNINYNIYGYGANYVQYYLKDNDWKQLDALFKKPPSTMNQLLHPYRHYTAKSFTDSGHKTDSAQEIRLAPGWNRVYKNNLGEFYLLMSLKKYLDKDDAEQASAGWKDDAVSLFENNKGQQVIVLWTAWNSPADAQGYMVAFKKWLSKKFNKIQEEAKAKNTIIRTNTQDLFSYRVNTDQVTIIGSTTLAPEEFESLLQSIS